MLHFKKMLMCAIYIIYIYYISHCTLYIQVMSSPYPSGPSAGPSSRPSAGPSSRPSAGPSSRPSAGPSSGPSSAGTDAGKTPLNYLLWLLAFICAQASSMWGQFVTLKFPNMGMFAAYKMAIPFAWLDWLFMSVAVNIGDKYKLVTPTQDTFTLITLQFTAILIINHFYLHQPLFRSDIVAFFMILFGFAVSFNNMLSKVLGRPVPTVTPAVTGGPSKTPGPSPAPLIAHKGDRKKAKLLKKIWGVQPTNDYSALTQN